MTCAQTLSTEKEIELIQLKVNGTGEKSARSFGLIGDTSKSSLSQESRRKCSFETDEVVLKIAVSFRGKKHS